MEPFVHRCKAGAKKKDPRYKAGDKAGNYNVLEYLRWGKLTHIKRGQHIYRVQCSNCGRVSEQGQDKLLNSEKTGSKYCRECREHKKPNLEGPMVSGEKDIFKLAFNTKWCS